MYINYSNNLKKRTLINQEQKKGLRTWIQGLEAQDYRNGNKYRNIKQVTSQEQNERTKNKEQKLKSQEHKSNNMK